MFALALYLSRALMIIAVISIVSAGASLPSVDVSDFTSIRVMVSGICLSTTILVHRVIFCIPSLAFSEEAGRLWIGGVDILVTAAELTGAWFLISAGLIGTYFLEPNFPESLFVFQLAAWFQGIFVVFHLIALLLKRLIWKRKPYIELSTGDKHLNHRTFHGLLLGRHIYGRHGNGSLPIHFRTLATIAILLAFITYAAREIFLVPIREAVTPPKRENRTPSLRNPELEKVVLNVIVTRASPYLDIVSDDWASTVNVTANRKVSRVSSPEHESCNHVDVPQSWRWVSVRAKSICPSTIDDINQAWLSFPEVLIQVDFSKLRATELRDFRKGENGTLPIILGLTNDTIDAIETSKSIPVYAGVDAVATISLVLQQRSNSPVLATIAGFLSSKRRFLTYSLDSLVTNSSAVIGRQNDSTGSLRIQLAERLADFPVVSEYRENDMLTAIARMGGLWTVLNGFCSIIFGGSLMWLVFGAKPLSIQGVLESPRIPDADPPNDKVFKYTDQQLLRFIRERVIDGGFDTKREAYPQFNVNLDSSKDGTPVEHHGTSQLEAYIENSW